MQRKIIADTQDNCLQRASLEDIHNILTQLLLKINERNKAYKVPNIALNMNMPLSHVFDQTHIDSLSMIDFTINVERYFEIHHDIEDDMIKGTVGDLLQAINRILLEEANY